MFLPAIASVCSSGTTALSTHHTTSLVIAAFTDSTETTFPHILTPVKHHGYPPMAGQSHQLARFTPPTPPMAPRYASRRSRQPHLPSGRGLQTARRRGPLSPSVCSLLGHRCFLDCVVYRLACLGSVALHAYGMVIYILVCSLVEGSC